MSAPSAKARGAYLTPPGLATSVSGWGIRTGRDRVLDPALGHGVFLAAANKVLRSIGATPRATQLHGVEVDADSVATATKVLSSERVPARVVCGDFFATYPDDLGGQFDVVVGNPPYVRHHLFKDPMRRRALSRALESGLDLPQSSDAWALYVAHSARFVAKAGRLAFVLPSSLLQADYARPVRRFLLERFGSVRVVRLVGSGFPGALVEVVLLLAAPDGPTGLNVSEWSGTTDLDSLPSTAVPTPHGAWAGYRQPEVATDLLPRLTEFVPARQLVDVRIGLVTGANDYFVISPAEAHARGFRGGDTRRLIIGPQAITGVAFGMRDLRALDRSNARSRLVWLSKSVLATGRSAMKNYIARGRRLGIHRRTKAAERDPWYFVNDWRVPDLFLPYMSHQSIRCAVNTAWCSSTNLLHHLTMRDRRHSAAAVAVAMQSSVAQLSAEALARTYGGGVLKLEPSDVGQLLLPPLRGGVGGELASALSKVDVLVRSGETEAARSLVDHLLITRGLITASLNTAVRDALMRVRAARLARGQLQRRIAKAIES